MTAHHRRRRFPLPGIAVPLFVLAATGGALSASAAVNCGDMFTIATVPTVFDGFMYDSVVMHSKTITFETASFGQWRPEEEKSGPAALTLFHQKLQGVRVDLCPLTPPDLPKNAETWKTYQVETAASLGDGTVVSDQVDTTSETGGVKILGWDTREARFTRTSPNGEILAQEFHFLAINGNTGVRFVLKAPPRAFDSALEDLRGWLNRLTVPGYHDN